MAAALLLELAGVPDEHIVADYALSTSELEPLVEERMERFKEYGISIETGRLMMAAPPRDMEVTLDFIRGRWGSAAGYLGALGLSPFDHRGRPGKDAVLALPSEPPNDRTPPVNWRGGRAFPKGDTKGLNRRRNASESGWLAERGRFELPVHCCTPLFENGTISHSDTSPGSILATSPSARETGTGAAVEPFTVACCQVRAHALEDAEENLQGLLRALDEAGEAGAQLVALPECAYPAYYVRDSDPYARPGVRPFAEVTALFAEKARRYGYWLAAGMAVPHEDGSLTNSGVVFDPSGEMVGRYDKGFLWHFDNFWFRRGDAFPVFDAGFARFGVLICADGRQPEIARSLAVNGAEVILDLTAWVSWASSVEQLSTTQCEYLMPARAFENGAWVAAADKWGPEGNTLIYAGRSCVIDPQGKTRVAAPSTGDQVVTYTIDPADGAGDHRSPPAEPVRPADGAVGGLAREGAARGADGARRRRTAASRSCRARASCSTRAR